VIAEQYRVIDQATAIHYSLTRAAQAHQGRLAAAEARLGASFLDTLLEGSFEPSGLALERARLLHFSPEASHRAAVVVLDEPLPLGRDALQKRERVAERLRRHLTSQEAMAVTSSQLRQVRFLLPAELDPARIWSAPAFT
jgi:PucR family transcriptional regulator, purine catabolism regulatory protein